MVDSMAANKLNCTMAGTNLPPMKTPLAYLLQAKNKKQNILDTIYSR